ncbi:aldehyde dehydrogenase family protein [Acidocella sp.]|uniref:aldehyde dehydrogenase family protein n=1 Tax=Acidocella sp. TaxID=50710 RepID=UPI003CFF927C
MNTIAKASANVPLHLESYGNYINGEWVESTSGRMISLFNPATGLPLATIQASNEVDTAHAVASAHAAFPNWSRTKPGQRQEILYEIAQRLKRRINDYAVLETLNNGKPIMEALHFDMPMAIDQFLLFSGMSWDLHGGSMKHGSALGIIHREALGVCAQIIPWNVPMIMLASKLAPALAAGNTIIMKPSEIVCLSVMEFFREMADLIPPGVVNLLCGYGPDVGEALVTDPRVRKVAFTGSRPTARKLIQYASVNIIPQTMELGGKSANIICEDADIDAAAEGAAMSVVLNKGEVCLAGSRVFVHKKVEDKFLDKFQSILREVRIGDPMNPETQLGAMASQAQFDKVMGYLEIGREDGAKVVLGGAQANGEGLDRGFYIQPTIFTGASEDSRISQEEIFGPVSTVHAWSDEEEMLRSANNSVYGLGGGVWTKNISQAHRIAGALETGTVWINRYYNFMTGMPIGGYKQSGFGREFGREVLDHYTLTKSVIINLDDGLVGAFDQT